MNYSKLLLQTGGIILLQTGGAILLKCPYVVEGTGGISFSGSADISITRVMVPTGGISFSGSATVATPNDFCFQFYTGGPGFKVYDLIIARKTDYDAVANKVVLYEIIAKVIEASVDGQCVANITSGREYLSRFGTEIVFTRFGNASDTKRQGSIFLTSDDLFNDNNFDDEGNAPYIDIRGGVSSYALLQDISTLKVRLGNLDGLTDDDFGESDQPSGYGLYSTNVFLKGKIIALAGGKIGSWNINTALYSGRSSLASTIAGTYIGIDGIRMGGTGAAAISLLPDGSGKVGNISWNAAGVLTITSPPSNVDNSQITLGGLGGITAGEVNGNVSSISGGVIQSGSTIVAGVGTNKAGLTGRNAADSGDGSADTDVRIWAGATFANRATAPFRVTQGGDIVTTNILATGVFQTAASGNRMVINTNGLMEYYISGSTEIRTSLYASGLSWSYYENGSYIWTSILTQDHLVVYTQSAYFQIAGSDIEITNHLKVDKNITCKLDTLSRTLDIGAADSGGTGYRMVRVSN